MQKSLKMQIGFTIHKNPTFDEPFFIIFYHMLQLHLNIDVTSTITTEYLVMYNNTCTHFPVELSILGHDGFLTKLSYALPPM